jgi:periplasmic divalent cation tolerance protein
LSSAVIVSTSIDSEAAARAIARAAVQERLAACAHVTAITSVYRWRGNVEEQGEWMCQLKTTPERAEALMARIRAMHPYEVPEIVMLPVLSGYPPYLQWVADNVGEA